MNHQLLLNIHLPDYATFANFYQDGNEAVVQHLIDSLVTDKQTIIYLWGADATGKSHLLQACCHMAQNLGLPATYLPLADYKQWQTSLFDNLEQCDLVCLDDIEQIAGQQAWEEACFDLYNRLHAAGKRLVIAGNTPPRQLNLKLADLTSRLTWALTLRVNTLSDAAKLVALQQRASDRGLELSDEVARFLLLRCPRNMQSLFATLEKLDQASLAAKRRLTIPFVKEVLRL
jgi:DnaA family protein